MAPHRFLCSQLVALTHSSGGTTATSIVNLEEIWKNGAILEAETPVAEGAAMELDCGRARFAGRIVHIEPHEFGWRLEVEFSPGTPWNPEHFQPEHLLDPAMLEPNDPHPRDT